MYYFISLLKFVCVCVCFNKVMVHRRIMTPTRIIDYLTKSPVSDVEKPPVELLVKEVQEASKTIEAIAIPLD